MKKHIDREHRERVRIASLVVVLQSKENGVTLSDLALLNGYFRCAAAVARNPSYKTQFSECSRILEEVASKKKERYTVYGRYFNKLLYSTYAMCDLFDIVSDEEFSSAAVRSHVA